MTMPHARILVAGLILGLLSACGTQENAGAGVAGTPSAGDKPLNDSASHGDCHLVNAEYIAEAFAGKLTPLRFVGRDIPGSGCTIPLAEVSESQLLLQSGDRGMFEMRRDSAQAQSGIEIMPVDVGTEGHLINSTQVIAIDEQGRSINVALQMITFGEAPPVSSEEAAAGVTLLARRSLDRL